jgi:hypothetical protein
MILTYEQNGIFNLSANDAPKKRKPRIANGERFRRCRLGELRRLFHDRYGPVLPDAAPTSKQPDSPARDRSHNALKSLSNHMEDQDPSELTWIDAASWSKSA